MRVNGKFQLFTSLVDTYQTPVYNLCFLLLGNRLAAEQAAQACFIRAYAQCIGDFPAQNAQNWFLRMAYQECLAFCAPSIDQINQVVIALRYSYRLELPEIAYVMSTDGEIVRKLLRQAQKTLVAQYCQEAHRLVET